MDALLASTDFGGVAVGELVFQNGMTVVEQVVGRFIERVVSNIDAEKNFVTTGKISDITTDVQGSVVNVYAHPHLLYQDRGVNGAKVKLYDTPHSYKDKMPPVDAIKQWIKKKQSFLTDKNDYHRKFDKRLSNREKTEDRPFKEVTTEKKIERAAWVIAKKIFDKGIPPKKIYSKEIPQLVQELGDQFANFTLQQIQQVVDINPREGGGNRIIIIQ